MSVSYRPIIFLRFNPSCFRKREDKWILIKKKSHELEYFIKRIKFYIKKIPNKSISIIQFYYKHNLNK
jgi:hypothetical protein